MQRIGYEKMVVRIHKCTFNYKYTINAKVFNYANTLVDLANYARFDLEYLETFLLMYTGEMKDPVGPLQLT